jgi:hypothetical protein
MARRSVRRSVPIILASSLFFFLKEGERAASCDLRWMQGPFVAVAILTRPTLGDLLPPSRPTDCFAIVYPGRALFPGGDGETQCSKIHSGEARDGSSLRSQAAIGPAVSPSLEQKGARPPLTPFCGAKE